MRRQDRQILNGALIAGGAMALIDILMQWMVHKDKRIDFTWDSYNGMRTFKRSLVGAAVDGGLGYAHYRYQISQEAKLPFNSDDYVKKILTIPHHPKPLDFFMHHDRFLAQILPSKPCLRDVF